MEELICPLCGQKKIDFLNKCSCGYNYESLLPKAEVNEDIDSTNKKQKGMIYSWIFGFVFSFIIGIVCMFLGLSKNIALSISMVILAIFVFNKRYFK